MGKRGPKRTPTEILERRGSAHGKSRRGEPKLDPSAPEPPDWLNERARFTWNQLVPMLLEMGVLTRIDGFALGRYCRLFDRWLKAEEFIDEHGECYPLKDEKGKTKYLQQFPQVAIARHLASELGRLEASFGLTPSARASLAVQRKRKPTSSGGPKSVRDAKARFFESGGSSGSTSVAG